MGTKKSLIVFKFILCLLVNASIKNLDAQITLDTIINVPNMTYYFNTVQISASETKYFIADTTNNVFNLYNMDFSPFILNVVVPEPFNDFNLNTIYRAIYVTRTLFDCDTSNIEYAYESATNVYGTFYIMRTDGTQLFKLDSANGPYCFGDCLGGADWIKPIVNTSSGAKLFLQRPNVINNGAMHIYSLCGTVPPTLSLINDNLEQSSIKVFPNPTSGVINFIINPPNNNEELMLIIVDEKGVVLRKIVVDSIDGMLSIDVSSFSSGNYFYSLCSKSKAYQNGKFILNK